MLTEDRRECCIARGCVCGCAEATTPPLLPVANAELLLLPLLHTLPALLRLLDMKIVGAGGGPPVPQLFLWTYRVIQADQKV